MERDAPTTSNNANERTRRDRQTDRRTDGRTAGRAETAKQDKAIENLRPDSRYAVGSFWTV